MDSTADFRAVAADPYGYGRKYKEASGKKMIGYFCSYVPEEVIEAAGAHPFRIFGTKGGIHLADAHLQTYCCSLVRGMLEGALSHDLDFLDGVVFPHSCDSIQRLSDIWRINIPEHFHLDLVLPVKLDTPSARQYYVEILGKFRRDLEKRLGVGIPDERIGKAIKKINPIRHAVMQLYRMRCGDPDIIRGSDFHAIIKAGMTMDRERFAVSLKALLEELGSRAKKQNGSGRKRLVLAGSICSHPEIYDIIEQAGGVVVWDDLCTGSRYYEGEVDESVPPLQGIAERYIGRISCPAKHTGLVRRGENLVRLVRESRAEGVIFLFLKFCDPHAFDYPYIREMLEREKIPSLMIDIEEQLPSGGQLATRLETFMEIL